MTSANIFNAIKEILQDSSDLSYIDDDNIFAGVRQGLTVFPCIVMEVVGDRLLSESYPNEDRAIGINVIGYIQVYDKDKQIAGDTDTKGVLDIENDIRKALSADVTLGLSDVLDTRLLVTTQDIETYPVRGFSINVEVHYRQNRLTRA